MISDNAFMRRETTPAERQAHKAFREVRNDLTDHEKAQKSFHETASVLRQSG
jgi:hypothetical protein